MNEPIDEQTISNRTQRVEVLETAKETASGVKVNHHEADMVIDTSGMSEGKRAALEMAERSRDVYDVRDSFVGSLFMGKFAWKKLHPYPFQSEEDKAKGDVFIAKLKAFLEEHVDPDEIDETGEIPDAVIKGLADMGAFGIKIKEEYKGLGLSQVNYCRTANLLGGYDANLAALVSAHQSIGVPQPLILFGTDEQKQKYLPKVAQGMISAFALTEAGVGSDPAKMKTTAEPTADGNHFLINGTKLWCTNGLKAGVLVVMASTPSKIVNGKERSQISAFIVDMDTPGIKVERRCHFMGLRALYNGVISFADVKVPRENIILAEGKGLKVALSTLNTGRLTLPAAVNGGSKACMAIVKKWSNERVQWGSPIGHHAAIADKIAKMAANILATDAMTFYTASLVDRKEGDIRLEAAMCKMFGSEVGWKIVDETMQIRGGRGYETARSMKNRGEEAIGVERMFRDCRINMIFEGSSEIMRLFIAREALDPHLKAAKDVMNSKNSTGQRLKGAMGALGFYAGWYPPLWLPAFVDTAGVPDSLKPHVRFAARSSKRLARSFFHAMAKHGPKLEREQMVLSHLVDIGTELFAISCVCAYAKGDDVATGDYFCSEARLRIAEHFRALKKNSYSKGYKLARKLLDA
ncbi:MAG: alkylation response protein AidB-like acyl-CoA dehydrogenase [Candidatus Omnitrophota bacterium]|jgi:alkylation response protein AidB-like acyl-CoA dehydrogenase